MKGKVKFSAGIKPKASKMSLADVAKKKFKSMSGKHGVGSGMLSKTAGVVKKRKKAIKKAVGG